MFNRIAINTFMAMACIFSSKMELSAQGNGPTQPEVTNFTPAGTDNMVSPTTGDFSYSIPLFDVGGYPLTLSYSAGRTKDEQASSVGLGWNLNVGMVSRSVRGIPDDFMGDQVKQRFNVKPNWTLGVDVGSYSELVGLGGRLSGNIGLGVFYNNYNGMGAELSGGLNLGVGKKAQGGGTPMNLGVGLSSNSQEGSSITPSFSINGKVSFNMALALHARRRASLSMGLNISNVNFTKKQKYGAMIMQKRAAAGRDNGNYNAHGLSGQSSYSFAGISHTPNQDLPFVIHSIDGKFQLGGDVFVWAGGMKYGLNYFEQRLAYKERMTSAFGVMYHHLSNGDCMVDVNREKDGAIEQERPFLPIPIQSSDIFMASGHGFNGSFQLRKADISVLHDRNSGNFSTATSLGGELAPGNIFNLGVNAKFDMTFSNSGLWDPIGSPSVYNFFPKLDDPNTFLQEPAYFRQAGEFVSDPDPIWTELGGDKAVAVSLLNTNSLGINLKDEDNNYLNRPIDGFSREKREIRNNVLYHYTASEASKIGLQTQIYNFPLNDFATNPEIIAREGSVNFFTGNKREGHHISEINAIKEGGVRYVFGLPAYNWEQKEKTFAITPTDLSEKALYTNNDDGTSNSSGKDNYFNETTTTAYAHSFMLTAVLSPEYQDIEFNGPTPDDIGHYTKFNYSRAYENWRWRSMYEEDYGDHHVGIPFIAEDDKVSYTYGVKEVWYIHSIENKTHVARFHYSNREDVFDVNGEDGGRPNGMRRQSLKKVDKIELFSRAELVDAANNNRQPIPLQTTFFEYDETGMMVGSPEAEVGKGKLTLKSLYTNHQQSLKGEKSKYKFEYNDMLPYGDYSSDQWGNLAPAKTTYVNDLTVTQKEYPYLDQYNPIIADDYAAHGNLSKIILPSGGEIEVDYEADDYAYVQDKASMSLFKITGVKTPAGFSLYGSGANALKVFFEPKVPFTGSLQEATERLKKEYVKSLTQEDQYVYVKAYINARGDNNYDYVPVYGRIGASEGIPAYGFENGDLSKPYVTLIPESLGSGCLHNCYINPISKAGFVYFRNRIPQYVFGPTGNTFSSNVGIQLAQAIWQALVNLGGLFEKPNFEMRRRGFCNQINLNKSFIRLHTPDGVKKGGGHRVKRIAINDKFGDMANSGGGNYTNSEYGTEYEYTTDGEGLLNKKNIKISSGVAEYEPLNGGEENPFRKPVLKGVFNSGFMVPSSYEKYLMDGEILEEPLGEGLFPGANVVYSKVTVKSLQNPGVEQSRAGYTVNEYYTAKDFPTKVTATELQKEKFIIPQLPTPWLSIVADVYSYSQGFAVQTNNMHGQPKKVTAFNNKGDATSFTQYHYKTKQAGPNVAPDEVGTLDNMVKVIKADGTTAEVEMGVDRHLCVDSRKSESHVVGPGVDVNLNWWAIPPFVWVMAPLIQPDASYATNIFRSIATTKIVHKVGILEKVEVNTLGSNVVTENVAYDAVTGEVLLTKLNNEFEDDVFNFKMPAHWVYKGMASSYRNIGASFVLNHAASGVFATNVAANDFTEGDILWDLSANNLTESGRYWVKEVVPNGLNRSNIKLINECGDVVEHPHLPAGRTFKIIKSGYANLATSPVFSFTTLKNPIETGILSMENDREVVNASAVEYSRVWKVPCGCYGTCLAKNHFRNNYYGQWRAAMEWYPTVERANNRADNPASTNTNPPMDYTNTRKDGVLNSFVPFWQRNNVELTWGKMVSPIWSFSEKPTVIHPDGNLMEAMIVLAKKTYVSNQNDLDLVFSGKRYGFSNQLITAVADNCLHNSAIFESFEDIIYERNINSGPCGNPFSNRQLSIPYNRLPLIQGNPPSVEGYHIGLYQNDAHSGKYSLMVRDTFTLFQNLPQIFKCDIAMHDIPLEISYPINPIGTNMVENTGYGLTCPNCLQTIEQERTRLPYVIEMWVKPVSDERLLETYSSLVEVRDIITAPFQIWHPNGPMIDGWQRLIFENLSLSQAKLVISASVPMLIDDIRIYPKSTTMKAYVYDDLNLRLTHELDENNFYTKFEYDEQGNLERVKKETEKGIMMIKESRFGQRKD